MDGGGFGFVRDNKELDRATRFGGRDGEQALFGHPGGWFLLF